MMPYVKGDRKGFALERDLKKEIKTWLKEQGAYFFLPVQTGYGASSLDFLVCLRGRFYGIECKAIKGKMTPRQGRVIREIKDAGGLAFVAKTLDEVKDWLGDGW